MAKDPTMLVEKIMDKLTAMLMNDASANTQVATQTPLTMSITGVDDIEAYANVVNYLKSKPDVLNVAVKNVGSTGMIVSFTLTGTLMDFKAALATDGRLKPVNAELIGTDQSADLFYYW